MPSIYPRLLMLTLLLTLLGSYGLYAPTIASAEDDAEEGFVSMFNGENLDGWYTILQEHGRNSDPDKIITIENGLLHIYKHAKDGDRVKMGYIATDKEYSHYHMKVDIKWGEAKFHPRYELKRDAGLFYHRVDRDIVWPRAMQCQIQQTDIGDIVTVGGVRYDTTIDPKTKGMTKPTFLEKAAGGVDHTHGLTGISHLSRGALYEVPEWNTIEIIVRGDRSEHLVNGKVVSRAWNIRRPDPENEGEFIPLTRGNIILELEAAELFYRNPRIKELDPSAE